jgi:hypothetical protein
LRHAFTNAYGNGSSKRDGDAHSHANADVYTHGYVHPDSNGYVHTHAVGYVHADANANARAEGNAYSETAAAESTAASVGRNAKLLCAGTRESNSRVPAFCGAVC